MRIGLMFVVIGLIVLLLPLVGCKQPEQQAASEMHPEAPPGEAAPQEAEPPDAAEGQPGEVAGATGEGTETAPDASKPEDAPAPASPTDAPKKEVDGFAVYVPDMTVQQGDIFTLPVRLTYAHNASGVQMTINYDADMLKIGGGEAVERGAALGSATQFVPNPEKPGVIRVAAVGTEPFNGEQEDLFLIHFKAVGRAGTTTVDVDETDDAPTRFGVVNEKGKTVKPPPDIVDGTITIE
jgi:hypothetical protein